MKKLILFLICLFFVSVAYADRNTATVTAYNSSTLVQRGDGKIYSITFVPTSNNGYFILLDAVSDTTYGSGYTDVKAEGQQATSGNSIYQNFSDKPLEVGTGIYLKISGGYVVLRYE